MTLITPWSILIPLKTPVHSGVVAGLLQVSGLTSAVGADPASERPELHKQQFNLFNPTPRAWLRELATDRPDKTESPVTVDAGHFQLEMDVATYTFDRSNPDHAAVREEAISIAPLNLKVGLLNDLDLQLIVPLYESSEAKDLGADASERHRGFGDMEVRAKLNLWGNDGGKTALAVMPAVKFPTSQGDLGNNSVEWGIIAPFAVELPRGWSLGAMMEVDFTRNAHGSGYHPDFVHSITFGHEIYGRLDGYAELFSLLSADRGRWESTADFGLTFGLTADIAMDAGVNIGLTRAADEMNVFMGISVRF